MASFLKNVGNKLHDLIYTSNTSAPKLTPEEAAQAAQNAKAALTRLNENAAWAQIQVNAEIEMIRMLPPGDPRIKQYRQKLKLRLVMQQYIDKMAMTMEMVNSQIELGQMTAEMGNAMKDANRLVSSYKRDMPSFTGFVRDFMNTVTPMNEALNGGLDEMTRALDQLTHTSLDGVFSEEDIDRLISGTASSIEPAAAAPQAAAQPAAPAAEPAKPAAAPTAPAKPAGSSDLLSSIEAELGNWKSQNNG